MSLKPEERELLETAKWGLDLIEMYEKRLEKLGDPVHLIHSPINELGKAKARYVISQWEWLDGLCIGSKPFEITLWKDRPTTPKG